MKRRWLSGLLIVCALALAGCFHAPGFKATVEDTRKIESLFPLVKDLGVDAYWVDDECRYFHYRRGSFSNDTSKDGGCRVWDYPDPIAFDAQANVDMDRLIQAIHAAGISMDYFAFTPPDKVTLSDEVDKNTFSIGYCNSLTFDPGYAALPSYEPDPDDPILVRAITPDWYETAC